MLRCIASRKEWIDLHERITIRMTSEMVARIDAWIVDQPGYVSRQDAVRRCVDLVLGQGGPEQPDLCGGKAAANSAAQQNVSS